MPKQKIHIIGIAGKTSSAVAKMFKDLGWEVSGSDQGMYPPVSDFLQENNIKVTSPYNASNVPNDVDTVVIAGNALIVDPDNPEYSKAKTLDVPILSYPEVLQEYVIKKNSIVVVGNFGKGTVSGAITKALSDLGLDPSYMVGGQLLDFTESLKTTTSDWSVVEGDEYPTPPLDGSPPVSKFFYYNPKYLILTSAEWDHYDKFSSEQEYVENYQLLVKNLPEDGLLVINSEGKNTAQLIEQAPCKVVTYGISKDSDYLYTDLGLNPYLFGNFNYSNLTAAYALLTEIGFDHDTLVNSLNSYQGLEYRMQKVFENDSTIVIRDLAHSPVKAQAALEAVRQRWSDHRIVGIFEIFSSSLKTKAILSELGGKFEAADLIFIPKVDAVERIDKENRATGKEIVTAIGDVATYLPKDELLLEALLEQTQNTVFVFMSSGGIRHIPERFLESLQSSP